MAMPMPGGWSMSMAWMAMPGQSWVGRAAMFLSMWETMMVAMMLPSVMPVVLLHGTLMKSRRQRGDKMVAPELFLLGGYFGVWLVFGAIAYAAGSTLSTSAMRYERVSRMIPVAAGIALMFAGWYQVTGWKQLCLSHCRSPIGFFSHHPLRKTRDSLTLGIHHGAYCAACCWALMLIQLALGIMSLPLMVGVALVIFLEKTWRHGNQLAKAVGVAAMAGGAVLAVLASQGL